MTLLHSGARGLTRRYATTRPYPRSSAVRTSKRPCRRHRSPDSLSRRSLSITIQIFSSPKNHLTADVREHPLSGNSLNAFNAASSQKTLRIELIIAVMGMALVLAYTVPVCWYCAEKSASPGRVVDGTVEPPRLLSPELGNTVGDNRK